MRRINSAIYLDHMQLLHANELFVVKLANLRLGLSLVHVSQYRINARPVRKAADGLRAFVISR